jgi:hypothetical protein
MTADAAVRLNRKAAGKMTEHFLDSLLKRRQNLISFIKLIYSNGLIDEKENSAV